MVNEELKYKDKFNYDYNTLGYAQIAEQYLKQGGQEGVLLAQKSLEKILTEAKVSDPWNVKTITDPKVLQKTIENQLGDYNQCKSEEKIEDLIDYHSGTFEEYSQGGSSRVREKLKDVLKMTYGELSFEAEKIKDKINGVKFGRTTKEDAETLKETLNVYQEVLSTIMLGESPRLDKFRSEVEYSFNKEMFKKMYPVKEQEEAQAA